MALCRWSSAAWYIYEPVGAKYHLEVCTLGQFSVVDIIRRYSEIEKEAKLYGAGFIARLELRAYLKLWAFGRMKKLSYWQYVKGLNTLRGLRQVEEYLKNPWEYEPFLGKKGNIPNCVQVEKVLCNKSLARIEAQREERRKIKESGLYQAMREE